MAPTLQFAFRLDVELRPAVEVGPTYAGMRRVIPITGGRFEGPRLQGRILPGGADWNVVRPDGITHLWARYELETDDGVVISVINDGLGRVSPETMARIFSGNAAEMPDWYTRTSPRFEVASPKYRWLNESIFVGDLHPPKESPWKVSIDVYEVL
jgi:Protein of unknown function (DUF3237)